MRISSAAAASTAGISVLLWLPRLRLQRIQRQFSFHLVLRNRQKMKQKDR
jgi:hypothetical protein